MSYEMNVTFNGEFLYVEVTGEDSYDSSLEFYTELSAACKKYDCQMILVKSNVTPLKTMDAYNQKDILIDSGFTYSHRIAWIELNPEAKKMDDFVENVLMNRRVIQAKVFSHESDAKQWLLRK